MDHELQKRFVLRVREDERNARTERSWNFLRREAAELVQENARKHGFVTQLLPVLGRKLQSHELSDHMAERLIPLDVSELTQDALAAP